MRPVGPSPPGLAGRTGTHVTQRVAKNTRNPRHDRPAARGITGTFYGQAMTGGDIYTVAGNGVRGFSGDGGPAARAALSYPDAVAVNGASLVFADRDTSRIRQVTG